VLTTLAVGGPVLWEGSRFPVRWRRGDVAKFVVDCRSRGWAGRPRRRFRRCAWSGAPTF